MAEVLLIEDDTWLAELYISALSVNGITVYHARSSKEGLQQLDIHASTIDLILLDMFLPDHNGIEFLHEVVSYDDCNEIPVIVLSSVSSTDFAMSDKRWRQYGVVQCLYKPAIKPADLAVIVKKQLLATQVSK